MTLGFPAESYELNMAWARFNLAYRFGWLGLLFGFYGISIIHGYLMLNQFLYK